MIFENKWGHGTVQFEMSPIPVEDRHRGCSFHCIVFDSDVGAEWCLMFGEETGYAQGYSSQLDLNAIQGAANTPYGPIGYIVWQIAVGTPQEVMVEHWLNIHEAETLRLLLEAGGQTHFKLVIYDVSTGMLAEMIEFENTFELDDAARNFAQLARQSEAGVFANKQRYAMQNLSLDQLIGNG